MRILDSRRVSVGEPLPLLTRLLDSVEQSQLRGWVERLSVPRHFVAEPEQNKATADWIAATFRSLGYQVQRQGQFANVLAVPPTNSAETILVGAHYDSVPLCPGADDNASAVAAMLACAAACREWPHALPVMFVAFNREEDNLMGSGDFVSAYLPTAPIRLQCAHVLEMVGYASSSPGSQRVPTGLPLQLGDRGDFLGLLANSRSGDAMELVLQTARNYASSLTVLGLEVQPGAEQVFPVLARSDHVPFWKSGIPAVMWTDTSEFRNPNYHCPTDTPATLDYGFLEQVARVLTAAVILQAEAAQR